MELSRRLVEQHVVDDAISARGFQGPLEVVMLLAIKARGLQGRFKENFRCLDDSGKSDSGGIRVTTGFRLLARGFG